MAAPNLSAAAQQLMLRLLADANSLASENARRRDIAALTELWAADLVEHDSAGRVQVSATGRAYLARHLARRSERAADGLDPFLAQHLEVTLRSAEGPDGPTAVRINEGESPLVWLARRKGADGLALISPAQLQAGERLRADFTRAQFTPRVTANWTTVPRDRNARGSGAMPTDIAIAARQRLRHALTAVGPEFSGLLLDVCCFLKRLEDVERERRWPARSAKVVLQLGLDRLARHYGLQDETKGPRAVPVRTWAAADSPLGA